MSSIESIFGLQLIDCGGELLTESANMFWLDWPGARLPHDGVNVS